MPLSTSHSGPPRAEPVEFSFEDALMNTWVDDSSVYLQLEPRTRPHRSKFRHRNQPEPQHGQHDRGDDLR
jgi:hypothetical protein